MFSMLRNAFARPLTLRAESGSAHDVKVDSNTQVIAIAPEFLMGMLQDPNTIWVAECDKNGVATIIVTNSHIGQ